LEVTPRDAKIVIFVENLKKIIKSLIIFKKKFLLNKEIKISQVYRYLFGATQKDIYL
jgi:hypothetical protein